jgi:hypothetical protein
LIPQEIAGSRNPRAIFSNRNYGDGDAGGCSENLRDPVAIIGDRRKSIRIHDHEQRNLLPHIFVDGLKCLFDEFVYAFGFFVEVFQFANVLHPGFFIGRLGFAQFLFDGFGDELAQGNALLGGFGLGLPEDFVGDLEGSLHLQHSPIFMGGAAIPGFQAVTL